MPMNIYCRVVGLAALLAVSTVLVAPRVMAGPSGLALVCTGNSYSKLGDPFPTEETVSFATKNTTHVSVVLPGSDQPTMAKIVSNNAIQLKFAAGGLTGEYFKFSADLFLIHKDGRFTRLVCKPAT